MREVSLLQNDHDIPDMTVEKCILIVILVPARPGEPSIGQIHGPPLVRKAIQYVCGSPTVAKASQIHRSSADRPCCITLCDANDPAAISFPKSLHRTLPF